MIDLTEATEDQQDDQSWHRLILCEEDRIARTGTMRPGAIGFRWFRSPNVIPIEAARRAGSQKS